MKVEGNISNLESVRRDWLALHKGRVHLSPFLLCISRPSGATSNKENCHAITCTSNDHEIDKNQKLVRAKGHMESNQQYDDQRKSVRQKKKNILLKDHVL